MITGSGIFGCRSVVGSCVCSFSSLPYEFSDKFLGRSSWSNWTICLSFCPHPMVLKAAFIFWHLRKKGHCCCLIEVARAWHYNQWHKTARYFSQRRSSKLRTWSLESNLRIYLKVFSLENRIRTRSQKISHPEQWTEVQVLVKIFKLIIFELSNAIESDLGKGEFSVRCSISIGERIR